MKAPDKIYVACYNGEAFSHSWTIEPLGDTTATEYIRKDALIEILQGYSHPLTKLVMQEIIDKINSL